MRFTQLAGAIASATSLTTASALVPRQSATQIADLGGWVEGMAVRSNGHLLLNRLDVPELWTIDPSTKEAAKVLSFTGALGLTGITEISPDVFAVVTGDFNATSFELGAGSYAIYTVDFTASTPTPTLVREVPESEFFIGLAAFDNDTIFIADAGNGSLYTMSISTGEYSVALSDPKMKAPADAFINEGIHGLKYYDGYLYFSNAFGGTLNKVKVDTETGKVDASITEISSNLEGPEDLIVAQDGSVYVATINGGAVFKVAADGTSSTFAAVTSGSACAFGRTEEDKDTLYMATSSGEVFSYQES